MRVFLSHRFRIAAVIFLLTAALVALMEMALSRIDPNDRRLFETALPIAALAGGSAWLLAGALSRRLERLQRAMQALRAGRLDVRAEIRGNDEIAQLAAIFNEMADAIEENLRAVQDRETLFRSLFENVQVAALVVDPENGAILDANAAACTFYGWSRDAFKKLKISDINLLSPEQIAVEMKAALEAKRNYFKFQHRLADGTLRDVEVYSGKIPGGKKPVLYSIVHDITQRIVAERELAAYRQGLEQLVAQRTAELEEKSRSLTELNSYFVGRELRMAELKDEIERLKAGKGKG